MKVAAWPTARRRAFGAHVAHVLEGTANPSPQVGEQSTSHHARRAVAQRDAQDVRPDPVAAALDRLNRARLYEQRRPTGLSTERGAGNSRQPPRCAEVVGGGAEDL
jgi:hypothetical protein